MADNTAKRSSKERQRASELLKVSANRTATYATDATV